MTRTVICNDTFPSFKWKMCALFSYSGRSVVLKAHNWIGQCCATAYTRGPEVIIIHFRTMRQEGLAFFSFSTMLHERPDADACQSERNAKGTVVVDSNLLWRAQCTSAQLDGRQRLVGFRCRFVSIHARHCVVNLIVPRRHGTQLITIKWCCYPPDEVKDKKWCFKKT